MSNRYTHDTPNDADSHYCPGVCGRMQGTKQKCPFCDPDAEGSE